MSCPELSRLVHPVLQPATGRESSLVYDLKPAHLHPHHQSQLPLCCPDDVSRKSQVMQPVKVWPSSPALMISGMADLCLCYQGQLYCAIGGWGTSLILPRAALVRSMACSPTLLTPGPTLPTAIGGEGREGISTAPPPLHSM